MNCVDCGKPGVLRHGLSWIGEMKDGDELVLMVSVLDGQKRCLPCDVRAVNSHFDRESSSA